MTDTTEEHPCPVQWPATEAYRRALAIATIARREYIARLDVQQRATTNQTAA